MQAGDADVVQPIGLQGVGGERDRRLVGDREVGRPRCGDEHVDVGPRLRPAPQHAPADLPGVAVGGEHRLDLLLVGTCEQHRPGSVCE